MNALEKWNKEKKRLTAIYLPLSVLRNHMMDHTADFTIDERREISNNATQAYTDFHNHCRTADLH